MVAGCLSKSLRSHWVCTCLSLPLIFACCLSLSPWSCCMSLTVSYCSWLSPTLSQVSSSFYMSLVVAGCLSIPLQMLWSYCISLIVSSSSMELLHVFHFLLWLLVFSHCLFGPMEYLYVSHCLQWLLSVSHCLFGPMELLHVSHCLLLLLAFSHCLYKCHGVAAFCHCLFQLNGVATCLTFSYIGRIYLTVSTSTRELLHVSYCLFQFHEVATCL